MKIGLLRETRTPVDTRVPLSPEQCRQLEDEFPGVSVFVQPGKERCFTDYEYDRQGITITDDLSACDILMGVKEVNPEQLFPGKTYFFFSHTIKKQHHNKSLLKAVLDRHIKLVDYEMLTDSRGTRIIGFGRWAGLVGTYNGIRAMCIRLNMPELPHPQECRDLKEVIKKVSAIHFPPLKIVVTGDGRVAGGAVEMLNAMGVQKIMADDYLNILNFELPVYVQLDPEKYNHHKSGKAFDLHYFFKNPEEYESSFYRFCDKTDMLIMAAYWDPGAPILFTPGQMKENNFRIRVIADITCDLNGSVPSTIRTTTLQNPYYDFNRFTGKEEDAFSNISNITVMAIDNLPYGLPKEASVDFGRNILNRVIPLLLSGDPENIITRATIAEKGELTRHYSYLADWVNHQD
jgi:saccharopine dehydrogenase (NAD+, L-lysine-forming)